MTMEGNGELRITLTKLQLVPLPLIDVSIDLKWQD